MPILPAIKKSLAAFVAFPFGPDLPSGSRFTNLPMSMCRVRFSAVQLAAG